MDNLIYFPVLPNREESCDSRKLFEGLEIAKDGSFETYLNQYDVICLDITGFISKAFIKGELQNIVLNIQDEVTAELAESYPNVGKRESLPDMLYQISQATGQKFIFIIDEWDALFREAKDDKFLLDSYIQLLRGLFKDSVKTDRMIEAAYMTGILPIKRYGSQSAVSDFREYTMLMPGKLAKYTGFTESETAWLCEKYGVDFREMKHWYDGYSFSRLKSVYNPNSVIEAVRNEEFEAKSISVRLRSSINKCRNPIASKSPARSVPIPAGFIFIFISLSKFLLNPQLHDAGISLHTCHSLGITPHQSLHGDS